ILYTMMTPLCRRGPDSAGVAIYGPPHKDSLVLLVKPLMHQGFDRKFDQFVGAISRIATVQNVQTVGECQKLLIKDPANLSELEKLVAAFSSQFEPVSMGGSLTILKQIGSPENLNATYSITSLTGTHGIGHTRMSTESRVDLSHSQPFGTNGLL